LVLSRGEKLELAGLSLNRDFKPAPAGRVQAVEIEQHAPSLCETREAPEYFTASFIREYEHVLTSWLSIEAAPEIGLSAR
jgi:hypothetical protein